jgi:hypothetical protein
VTRASTTTAPSGRLLDRRGFIGSMAVGGALVGGAVRLGIDPAPALAQADGGDFTALRAAHFAATPPRSNTPGYTLLGKATVDDTQLGRFVSYSNEQSSTSKAQIYTRAPFDATPGVQAVIQDVPASVVEQLNQLPIAAAGDSRVTLPSGPTLQIHLEPLADNRSVQGTITDADTGKRMRFVTTNETVSARGAAAARAGEPELIASAALIGIIIIVIIILILTEEECH